MNFVDEYIYMRMSYGAQRCDARTMQCIKFSLSLFPSGMWLRTALISAIYRKSLNLSSFARQSTTVGEIVNLMGNDEIRKRFSVHRLSVSPYVSAGTCPHLPAPGDRLTIFPCTVSRAHLSFFLIVVFICVTTNVICLA